MASNDTSAGRAGTGPADGPQPIAFEYRKPSMERAKKVVRLARTDLAHVDVQVVREGGENNLHSHRRQEGVWFVLRGTARFYGDGDRLIATVGPDSGVVIPRGCRYWFESAGEDDLEILHVTAVDLADPPEGPDRTDHVPPTERFREILEA